MLVIKTKLYFLRWYQLYPKQSRVVLHLVLKKILWALFPEFHCREHWRNVGHLSKSLCDHSVHYNKGTRKNDLWYIPRGVMTSYISSWKTAWALHERTEQIKFIEENWIFINILGSFLHVFMESSLWSLSFKMMQS